MNYSSWDPPSLLQCCSLESSGHQQISCFCTHTLHHCLFATIYAIYALWLCSHQHLFESFVDCGIRSGAQFLCQHKILQLWDNRPGAQWRTDAVMGIHSPRKHAHSAAQVGNSPNVAPTAVPGRPVTVLVPALPWLFRIQGPTNNTILHSIRYMYQHISKPLFDCRATNWKVIVLHI